jgi:predicted dehydrogenase
VTAGAVRADVTGRRPDPRDVAQLAGALRAVAHSIRDGRSPEDLPLPDSEDVRQLADRIGDVRRALTGDRVA